MRERNHSPSNPLAFDSPQTHCVPSLVCPNTPCVSPLQNSSCLLIHPQTLLVHSPSELFTFAHTMGFRVSDEGTHSLAIKSPRVRFPSNPLRSLTRLPQNSLRFHSLKNSLCLLIHPQTLLVHSPSKLFTYAHAMGFRRSDEGMHSLAIKSTRVRFP